MNATTRPAVNVDKPNRREFLYYVGGASLALMAAGSCGVLTRFLNPPLHGEEAGIFQVNLVEIPTVNTNPVAVPKGQYWLTNMDHGLLALYGVCTFMIGSMPEGKLVKWAPTNHRFECPGCGSKYELDGTYIEGISKRGLDRFTLEIITPNGRLITPPDGSPVSIANATQILVDTNRIIYGQPRRS